MSLFFLTFLFVDQGVSDSDARLLSDSFLKFYAVRE